MSKKKDIKMKHILIPIIVLIVALIITAFDLGNPGGNSSAHTHEEQGTYHVHEDGQTHYGEH